MSPPASAMKRQRFGGIRSASAVAGRTVSPLAGLQYPSAKAGILGPTPHLAQNLDLFGIAVNAVAPGPTLVDCVAKKWALRSEEDRARILANIPLGCLAMPEEVVPVIAFLGSEDAVVVTGVRIDVNGGRFIS